MKTVLEIMNEINGKDENGDPKAIIGLQHVLLNQDGSIVKTIDKEDVLKPEVYILPKDGFLQIDVKFDKTYDISLIKMWKILENFTNESALYYADEKREENVPALIVNLLPMAEDVDSYVIAANPIIQTLTASDSKSGINCIRMLFNADNVHFFFSDDAIDMKEIDTEVANEVYKREMAEQKAAEIRNQRISNLQQQNIKRS